MNERKKLSLNKTAQATNDASGEPRRKPPARGAGTAPRKRMTAAEAAQARQEREEAQAQPPHRSDDDRAEPGWSGNRARPPAKSASSQRPASQGTRGKPTALHAPSGRTPASGHPASARPAPQHPASAPRAITQPDLLRQGRAQHDAPPAASQHLPSATQPTPREDDGRVRLSKLMSERGLASRREADEWIEQGWVRVDGEVVNELGSRVFAHQSITIDPAARKQQAQRVTILIHKPIGYVSGQAEEGYEPAVTLVKPENRWREDRLPIQLTRGHLRNLAPAGRLDIDSTGLLVLTQDGRIAKQLIGEDSGIEKEYLVRVQSMAQPDAEKVSEIIAPDVIERLRLGLELDGRPLKAAQVSWQNEQQLRFVLREGRKRQIRRMCEMVGLKVIGLKRVRMGRITLGKLPAGQWRFLRPDERF